MGVAAVDERTGVAGIVQHAQHDVMVQRFQSSSPLRGPSGWRHGNIKSPARTDTTVNLYVV
jgi:hypothetical protein